MTTVAVLGGGIAGLSAAHELAERGFSVTVYEAKDRFGGKARSLPGPTAPDGARLPSEHGFRFFPGFYRHVTDTMSPLISRTGTDIPVRGLRGSMNDRAPSTSGGWFEGIDPDDSERASEAVTDGRTAEPQDWPAIAVESGYADSEEEYYQRLHEATLNATRREVRKRERADDRQLVHAVRAMDDRARVL